MKIYLCDPEKDEECSKMLCQKLCFQTFHKEYAKLDENGEPIVAGDTGDITMEFYAEGSEE